MANESSRTLTAPEVKIETGWEEVELPFHIGSGRSIYTGLEGHDRLRLRLFHRTTDGHAIGRVWFGPGADGPPGHVHGGATAYVLDEAMGAVGWMNNYPIVAAKIEFQLLRMTPLQTDLVIESWISQESSRRITTLGELRLPTGEVCVQSKGEFAVLSKEKIKPLASFIDDPKGHLQNPKLKWLKEGT